MFRFFNVLDLTFNIVERDTTKFDASNSPTEIQHRITFTLALDGGATIPVLNGEVIFEYVRRGNKWLLNLWEDQQI